LIRLYDHYEDICTRFFNHDANFVASLDKAFHALLNERRKMKQPEVLARYCDQMLRRQNKLPVEEQERKLKRAIKLFGYLDDKDIFQKFYTRAMAKRLISESSASEDLELMVISLLRASII
jgi:cullin 1